MKPKIQGSQLFVTKVRPDGTAKLTALKLPKDVSPDIGRKLPVPKQ